MKNYYIVDIFGNENKVSRFDFYCVKTVGWIVVIGCLGALLGILKDIIFL